MTNPANVTVITDKLISYLTNTKDEFMKADLVSKITQLAERYPYPNIDKCTCRSKPFNFQFHFVHNFVGTVEPLTVDTACDPNVCITP